MIYVSPVPRFPTARTRTAQIAAASLNSKRTPTAAYAACDGTEEDGMDPIEVTLLFRKLDRLERLVMLIVAHVAPDLPMGLLNDIYPPIERDEARLEEGR